MLDELAAKAAAAATASDRSVDFQPAPVQFPGGCANSGQCGARSFPSDGLSQPPVALAQQPAASDTGEILQQVLPSRDPSPLQSRPPSISALEFQTPSDDFSAIDPYDLSAGLTAAIPQRAAATFDFGVARGGDVGDVADVSPPPTLFGISQEQA